MDSRERRDSAKLPCEEPSALDAHAPFCGGERSGNALSYPAIWSVPNSRNPWIISQLELQVGSPYG